MPIEDLSQGAGDYEEFISTAFAEPPPIAPRVRRVSRASDFILSNITNAARLASRQDSMFFVGDSLDVWRDPTKIADASADLVLFEPPETLDRVTKTLENEVTRHEKVADFFRWLDGTDLDPEDRKFAVLLAAYALASVRMLKEQGCFVVQVPPDLNGIASGVLASVFGQRCYQDTVAWRNGAANPNTTHRFAASHENFLVWGRTRTCFFNTEARLQVPESASERFGKEGVRDQELTHKCSVPDAARQVPWQSKTTGRWYRPALADRCWFIPRAWYDQCPQAKHWTIPEQLDRFEEMGLVCQSDKRAFPTWMQPLQPTLDKGYAVNDLWVYVKGTKVCGHSNDLDHDVASLGGALVRLLVCRSPEAARILLPFATEESLGAVLQSGRTFAACGHYALYRTVNTPEVPIPVAFENPTTREDFDAKREADGKPFRATETWMLSRALLGPNPCRGPDDGFDQSTMTTANIKVLIEVKTADCSRKAVDELLNIMNRHKVDFGVFLLAERPSAEMLALQEESGLHSSGHPRIQFLTLEDLFAGKQPSIPAWGDFVPWRPPSLAGRNRGRRVA